MIGSQQERALFFQQGRLIHDDLSAKDLHGKADNYLEKPIEQRN
jgi:hypothetical protein